MSSVVDSWNRRDRLILSASLVLVVGLAWAYLIAMARDMQGMDMPMSALRAWTTSDFTLMFLMWTVMMIAMMTPSASPMVFMFARLKGANSARSDASQGKRRGALTPPLATSWFFLAGYLVIWTAFSAVATLAQWALHTAALLSPMLATTSDLLGGVLLLVAGVFQLTPLKQACLAQCRSPLGFLMAEWRAGAGGAFVMGLRHGTFCAGCCWALMALLFVAGVMNLLWVAIIAGFVLIEKIAPAGHWLGQTAGILLLGWGGWLVAGALI